MFASFLMTVFKTARHFKTTGSGTFCSHVAHIVEMAHHAAVLVHLTH